MVVPLVSWQLGSVPAMIVIGVGVPTVGVIVTVRVVIAEGPLHPLAITWIFTVPEKPLVQVMTPVEELMDPAEGLLILQTSPVDAQAVLV